MVAYSQRCTGHTIGEIKKPYEFLVWVSTPNGEDLAVTPTVGETHQEGAPAGLLVLSPVRPGPKDRARRAMSVEPTRQQPPT